MYLCNVYKMMQSLIVAIVHLPTVVSSTRWPAPMARADGHKQCRHLPARLNIYCSHLPAITIHLLKIKPP